MKIGVTEFDLLGALFETGPSTTRDLQKYTGRNYRGINNSLRNLLGKGLVGRDFPPGKSAITWQLTTVGIQVLNKHKNNNRVPGLTWAESRTN